MAIGMEVAAADGTNEFEDELDAAAHLLAADHIVGPVHPRLLLLEYGDDECPSCAYAEPVTLHLIETFAKHLRFVFRHFPLVHVHPHAEMAAEAAEAAAVQDKFWAMHHALFTHSTRLTPTALTMCRSVRTVWTRRCARR